MSCTSRSSRWQIVLLVQCLLLLMYPTCQCDAQCVGGVSHRLKISTLLDTIYPPWSAGCLSRAGERSDNQTPIDERLPVDWDSLMISGNETVSLSQHQPNQTDTADYLLDVTVQRELDDGAPVRDEMMSATEAGE
uniref:Uncharacterized protein n=1 Tax=Anopheles maculatus TaxID=74869 RepID=A0A182SCU1_9DIPT